MPAQSKSQQRFFGVVKAMQKGDIPKKGKAGKIAKQMSKDDVDDFASTKHKGKPEKVKKEQKVENYIKKMVRQELNKINETLPNKVTDKFKNLVDKPKSKAAKDFQKQHSTSMADGEQGTIAEPDTYDWDDDMNDEAGYQGDEKDKKKYGYEPVKEDFAGSYPKHMRKKFDKKRQKQAEVLGYKLTGKSDIKSEIGDATIKEGKLTEKKYDTIMKGDKVKVIGKYIDSKYRGKKGKVIDMGINGNNYMIKIGSTKMILFPDDIVKEGKLTEKSEYTDFISKQVDSLKGSIKYVQKALRQKDIKDWEKKEFTQALKGLKSKLRITTDHLKQVQKMDEGKLNEGKETIFDVAARVMKDKQNQNYKSKVGMVKVDMQSANLLTKVWKKVNPKMKKILSDLGEKNPAGLMKTLWAVVK
jgi:hypothetical protein